MTAHDNDSALLLEEFTNFLDKDMRTFFGLCATLSDLSCGTYGNMGALAPVSAFLSLCGLPLPTVFGRWEATCTAFAPFLRGHLRFYLDAQSQYVRRLVGSLEDRLTAVENMRVRKPQPFRPELSDEAKHMVHGLRNLSLAPVEKQAKNRLHWHGRPVYGVTTLDEWLRVTHGYEPSIHPGMQVQRIVPNDADELPFYAVRSSVIEAGTHRGKTLFRMCSRPATVPALVHYDLSPDHPLSQWLSGYDPLPDQLRPADSFSIEPETAGDWASFSSHDPLRQLVVGHLQQSVTQSFSS